MNRTETLALTRYVQALCPAQKLDEFSADAWHDVLGDLPLGVAKKAASLSARRRPFVAPSEIISAANRLRRAVKAQVERETLDEDPPQHGPDYIQWRQQRSLRLLAEADRRISDDVYDLTRVDLAEDPDSQEAFFNTPAPLNRKDGRPAIEPPRPADDPQVPIAEVLHRARTIRDASRLQEQGTPDTPAA